MAPRKKAAKNQPGAAPPAEVTKSPAAEIEVQSQPGTDLAGYPEVQKNEYLATEAIYPDGFLRLHGKKDAWKNQENLSFQVRLMCLENRDIFIKLDFEFAKDYPKVPLKVNVVDVQPKNPKLSKELSAIITTIPRSNLGSECVHEVTGRVDELLNSTAVSRAAKENPFSLEEERAHREAAARSAAQQQEQLIKKKQQDETFQSEQALALRLESERKRREQAAITVPDEMAADFEVADSSHQVKFDQAVAVQDTLTGKDISFKTVDGRLIITRRDDKLMVLVTPGITDKSQNPPQLLLKRIFLPQRLGSKEDLQRKMGQIEELLAKSKKQRHENIVDLLGYRIIEPASETTDWELDIVSDWAREGSLENLLQLSGTLTAARVKDWIMQLIEALIFLEAAGFVHPAIHASNVLIFRSRSGAVTVKLSDGYGTALRNLVDEARPPNSPEASVGRPWKAPELNPDKSNRTAQTCIWDLGNVVLHMALGQDVFEHFATPYDCLSRKPFTLHFRDLLVKLFEKHPRDRPPAFKLKSEGFFFDKPPVLFHQSEFPSGSRGPKGSHEVSEMRWESNWDIIEQLGKGGQGKVVKARNINDQGIYAVKMIPAKNSDVLTVVRQEVLLLKDLKHPSIVRYYSAWTEQNPEETTTSTSYSSSWDGDPINLRGSRRAPTTQRPPMTIPEVDDFMGMSQVPVRELESAERLFGGGGIAFAKPSAGASDDNSADYANAWGRVAVPPGENQAPHPGGMSFEDSGPSVHQNDDNSSEGGRNEDDQDDPEQDERDRRAVAEIEDRKRKSTLYIQMEYCDQKTLRQMIRNYDLPSTPDEMWRVFRSILDGLKYIHEQGITHRDLKPDNIFLDSYNNPKIGDFGLATAAFAAHSGNVGTPYYIAPELLHLLRSKDRNAGKLGSKVDMYSLGIMFFEMNFPLPTTAEKFQVLGGLNQAQHKLPQRFGEPEYEVQGRIILELIDHNPKARPEAADLLDRPEIPEPIEDEKLRRRLFWMMEKEPDTMLAWLKGRPNDDVLDLSWDYKGKDEKFLDPVTVDFVISELRNLFHRHGAVSTARQGPFPKAVQYNNPATYLAHDGLVLQLPQDLTLPFARTVAHQYPEYSKCYSIDSVFRPRPDRSQGDEPFRILEVDFDVVSPETTDLSLKDATAICVLDDIVRTFPALDASSWNILLSHNDLIDLILQSCRIAVADFTKVKKQLATLYSKGVAAERIREQWETIRATLRSKAFNIRETSVAALSKFVHTVGSVVEVQAQLSKLLEKDALVADAVACLARLQEILKYLERFRLQTSVSVAPLSNNGEGLYPGSVMFQCVHRKSGTLAAGGRYDNLIRYHQRGMQGPVIARAVGFRLNLGLIVSRLASAANASSKLSKTTSRDHSAAAASLPAAPSRVDVLVTSFDAASRTSAGLDCLSLLLAGGIATELTEEVETMEGIEEMYARDTPYWLVIVKGMALAEDGKVKVRTPAREEVEVAVKELVSWLGREMGRKGKARRMRDRLWRSLCRVLLLQVLLHFSLLTGVNADDNERPLGAGASSNDTLLWGPYRPNLYFGVRPRIPKSLLTGLVWANVDSFATINNNWRHTCEQHEGMAGYGWDEYDARNGGRQVIQDTGNKIDLTIDFVKVPGPDGGSWGARVRGTPREDAPANIVSTILFYAGLEGLGEVAFDEELDQKGTVSLNGRTNELGEFHIDITEGPDNHLPYKTHKVWDKKPLDRTLATSAQVPPEALWQAKNIIYADMKPTIDGYVQEYGQENMPPPWAAFTISDSPKAGNFHVVQKVLVGAFEFDILFSAATQARLTSSTLDHAIGTTSKSFKKRFQDTLKPLGPFNKAEYTPFSESLFSNLLGGVGYFYGDSMVDRSHAPEYDEENEGFWEETAEARSRAEIVKDPPAQLFTSVPSRPFFPRGFLWDEGFHLIPIVEYDLDLTMDIVYSWFSLMDSEGWIAREQILGLEARSKVPAEFQVQYPHYANPPTLFMIVETLVEKANSGKLSSSEQAKVKAHLESIYPLLRRQYNWFRRTQHGDIKSYDREAFSTKEAYRWRGRTPQHILTSGLDDYPRPQPPHPGELHLDLISWVGMMQRTLISLSNLLGENDDTSDLTTHHTALLRNLDDLHWSPNHQTYCDATIDDYEESTHVCHKGYISLFPFMTGLLPPSHPNLPHILNLISNPDELWSPYGIRSLSQTDEFYGTEENYWRSPIWVNMNYLIIRNLYLTATSTDPAAPKKIKEQARKTYVDLRRNLCENVYRQWKETGFAWEQYNPDTGRGQRTQHFTGWTSLVTVIMHMEDLSGGSGSSGGHSEL